MNTTDRDLTAREPKRGSFATWVPPPPLPPRRPREPWPDTGKAAVLQAARAFGRPFTLTELVEASWLLAKPLLGLKGLENVFPCSRTVYATLTGPNGLLGKRFLRSLGNGMYEVPR